MKCEICGKDILKDSQCINYKYYHNDCIINLIKENQKYKEVIDRLNFIKNRKNQGVSQENINKMAIEFVNNYLKEVSEWIKI